MESLDVSKFPRKTKPMYKTHIGDEVYERTEAPNKTCTFVKLGKVKNEITGLSHHMPFRRIELETCDGNIQHIYMGGYSSENQDRYYLINENK